MHSQLSPCRGSMPQRQACQTDMKGATVINMLRSTGAQAQSLSLPGAIMADRDMLAKLSSRHLEDSYSMRVFTQQSRARSLHSVWQGARAHRFQPGSQSAASARPIFERPKVQAMASGSCRRMPPGLCTRCGLQDTRAGGSGSSVVAALRDTG